LNTKIHAVVDGLGNPVEFFLSPGNDHDSTHAIELLDKVEIEGSNVLGDRAFDTDAILEYLEKRGAVAVIPSKTNRLVQRECDWWLYKERHLVECVFQKIKWFRRVATRYDKSDDSFLGFVYLAAICILVK
jgi:transposase